MEKYTEQKFNIPELKGISRKAVEEHMKLYLAFVCCSCDEVTESGAACPSCTSSAMIPLSSLIEPVSDEREQGLVRVIQQMEKERDK